MDTARAFSVLSRVLCHLPPGIWWPLCQHSPNDPHVAHALSLPAANLDSLLVLAGVGKETANGFGPLEIANLPCNCKHCGIDPNNNSCKFTPWQKRRLLHIADNVQLPSAPSISSSASESSDDDSESSDDDEEEMTTIAQLK